MPKYAIFYLNPIFFQQKIHIMFSPISEATVGWTHPLHRQHCYSVSVLNLRHPPQNHPRPDTVFTDICGCPDIPSGRSLLK